MYTSSSISRRASLARSLSVFGFVALFALAAQVAHASVSVSIQSLSPSTSVSVGTPVSFTVQATGFTNPTYTLSDSDGSTTVSSGNINTSGSFSWTPTSTDIGSHTLSIAVNDSSGNTATTSEQITVSQAPTVSIQSLSPSSSVNTGTTVSFSVIASGFTSPIYSLSDSFGGGTVSTANINSSGYFSWTPTSSDAGTHTITVTVSDNSGHSGSATETLSVANLSCQITSFYSSPNVIASGGSTSLYWNTTGCTSVTVSGPSLTNYQLSGSANTGALYSNTSYTISASGTQGAVSPQTVTVSVTGSTSSGSCSISSFYASPSSIASGGSSTLYWTTSGCTSASVSGTNVSNTQLSGSAYTGNLYAASNYTLYASGPYGSAPTQIVTIYVNGQGVTSTTGTPSLTVQSLSPGSTVSVGSPVTFTAVSSGFTNPTYTVNDSFGTNGVATTNINSAGYFSWTPTAAEIGTHSLVIWATDAYDHSASTTLTLTVSYASTGAVTFSAVSPSAYVAPATTVSFTAFANGFTNPTFTASDSFPGNSFPVSTVNTSGYFFWTPLASDVGTHVITVAATDAYGHSGAGQLSVTVSGTASVSSTTTASFTPVFTSYLINGSSGTEVILLQALLAKLGLYTGTTSGSYDAATASAVEQFQSVHGLSVVGVVGPQTRTLLNQYVETGTLPSSAAVGDGYKFITPLANGSTGTAVSELQKRLTAEGVYSGPVNGRYGPLTEAAVKLYQKDHSIQQLGNVGPATRASLNG